MDRQLAILIVLGMLYNAGVPVAKLRAVCEKLDAGDVSAREVLEYLLT